MSVPRLPIAPVKGMRVTPVDRLALGPSGGADGDRVRFGIWCDVTAPGHVRIGNRVAVT